MGVGAAGARFFFLGGYYLKEAEKEGGQVGQVKPNVDDDAMW